MPRSSKEVMAEALREIDARFGRIETLLTDIKQIIVDLADGQMRADAHAKDAIDRIGTRVLNLETRLGNGR